MRLSIKSFQEFFAGSFLCEPNRVHETKFITYLLQNSNTTSSVNAAKSQKRNWGTIEFASNQDASNHLISYAMRFSAKKEDPNALELVANCIFQDAT